MAGIVYLRTNRFDVKLEGITFKAKDFQTLSTLDFLFPDGKVWPRPPVVGLDVMRHPRDPNIILLLLGIGVGCVILRFSAGGSLPEPILKFLTDERIRFVGFGIPEKKNLFPFDELGLRKNKVDIGYLAAKHLNDPKYKRSELGALARKTLGVKRMIGLTDASSFERHEQIKCAICQLFISNVIAMTLLGAEDKKKLGDSPRKGSLLKSLNSLPLLKEGWFKLTKVKKDNNKLQTNENFWFKTRFREGTFIDDNDIKIISKEDPLGDGSVNVKSIERVNSDDSYKAQLIRNVFGYDLAQGKSVVGNKDDCGLIQTKVMEIASSDDSDKDAPSTPKKTIIKGILKCPSTSRWDLDNLVSPTSPSVNKEQSPVTASLRRANSKGFNVSFK